MFWDEIRFNYGITSWHQDTLRSPAANHIILHASKKRMYNVISIFGVHCAFSINPSDWFLFCHVRFFIYMLEEKQTFSFRSCLVVTNSQQRLFAPMRGFHLVFFILHWVGVNLKFVNDYAAQVWANDLKLHVGAYNEHLTHSNDCVSSIEIYLLFLWCPVRVDPIQIDDVTCRTQEYVASAGSRQQYWNTARVPLRRELINVNSSDRLL